MAALKVSIARVRITGYRSCKSTIVSLEPSVTALIGPNGAGKTNLLQALRLLKSQARRFLEDEIEQSSLQPCTLHVDFLVGRKQVKYRVLLLLRQGENNTDIVIRRRERWNFADFGLPNKWVELSFRRFAQRVYTEGDHSEMRIESSEVLLVDGAKADVEIAASRRIERVRIAVKDYISRISYYSASGFTNPALCPTSFEITDSGVTRVSSVGQSPRSGGAHLTFLKNLYSAKEDLPQFYARYISVVGKAGVGLIEKINWKRSTFYTTTSEVRIGGKVVRKKTKRTLLIPTVVIGGDELSFNQLSEGTFRSLAILFYIMRGGRELLLLEEPEVCVHYGLLDSVITVVREIAHTKQVVLSTHSDAVIDMLSPESVRLVRLFGARGTTVNRLSKQMSAKELGALRDYLENTGTLGEYWRHSGFE